MSASAKNTVIKLIVLAIIALTSSIAFYRLIFIPARVQLTGQSGFSLSPFILCLWYILMITIASDLLFRKKITLFIGPAVYFFTFFTANEALWASELIWNKNYALITGCLMIYFPLISLIIFREGPKFTWLFKGIKTIGADPGNETWKSLSWWNKILSIAGFLFLSVILLYVPYKVILTIGYVLGTKKTTIQAKIIESGSIRGKYFYHRYWTMDVQGSKEKFWVYAAAETEPVEAHSCATAPDPPPGTVLLLEVRKGPFGVSYDRIAKMYNEKGHVICD